jgi:hypothetical protein
VTISKIDASQFTGLLYPFLSFIATLISPVDIYNFSSKGKSLTYKLEDELNYSMQLQAIKNSNSIAVSLEFVEDKAFNEMRSILKDPHFYLSHS